MQVIFEMLKKVYENYNFYMAMGNANNAIYEKGVINGIIARMLEYYYD